MNPFEKDVQSKRNDLLDSAVAGVVSFSFFLYFHHRYRCSFCRKPLKEASLSGGFFFVLFSFCIDRLK